MRLCHGLGWAETGSRIKKAVSDTINFIEGIWEIHGLSYFDRPVGKGMNLKL